MRAINVYPDGLIALLAAVAVADILLASLAVSSLRCLNGARRKKERFSRQHQFPQLIGMSVSLSCYIIIVLLLWSGSLKPRPPMLNVWLDELVLLWPVLVLALWPVSSCMVKTWSRQHSSPPSGEHHEAFEPG